jgi:hypothetical protein
MKTFLTFALIVFSLAGYSQTKETLLIKTWKLKSHNMTGIGVHNSLPKEMQIEFLKDGTWKSSSPWEGATQGKWSLKNNERTLKITFKADEDKDFRIAEITSDQLQLENLSKLAVFNLVWTALK